ncbi:MAG: helix-turn-helix domain-containing protein [Pseudomonas piscis]|uniref:helix-turn-helix domain-containing protein n=1 Tax=Pseudomonas piscis TaxID=2614538 RepID=UPI003D2DC8DC
MNNDPMTERGHNTAFGSVLAQLRKGRGLSQERLGFESGFDRSYISLLERGLRSPTLDTLFSLSHALEVSFVQLAMQIEAKLEDMSE